MKKTQQDALTELILETFRFNGQLLSAGDALVADLGLTSARWQVIGAVALSPVPLPVAHIARNMGLTRQAVQRLVNELARAGMLRFAANPHHQRAKLVLLTPRGVAAYEAAMKRQIPWAKSLAQRLSIQEIDQATATLRSLRHRLEGTSEGGHDDA
ncbi:MAG: MarR family transcriptional regulator [Methylovirgula sp.]